MIVRIGDTVFSSHDDMVLLILTEEEKQLIKSMKESDYKACFYPEDTNNQEILQFMEFGDDY